MANEILRQQLLNHLAHEYETNGPGMISTNEIAEKIGITFSQIEPVVYMLHSQGLIETVVGGGGVMLKSEGYRLAKPSDICVPKSGGTHVNFNAPVSGSAIAVGNSSAQVINNNDNSVAEHLNALKSAIEQLAISSEIKADSKEIIAAIESQFSSQEPSKAVVKTLLNSLPQGASIASIGSFILACLV